MVQMTITTDELDRLGKNIVAMPGRIIIGALSICCIVLDVIGLIGLNIAPAGIAKFACEIRPFGMISSPLFSDDLLQYAAAQCSTTPREPLISIVFLMVKYGFGMLILLVACCSVIVRPQGLASLCVALKEYVTDAESYYRERRRWAKRLLIVVGVAALALFQTSQATVSRFNTSLLHKLFEDGIAILIPATIFGALIFLVMFIVVRPRKRNFM
jgi:hypothetical protein